MELSTAFNLHSPMKPATPTRKKERARRRPPFSLRLTEAEHVRLSAEAKGLPLGTYIKAKLLGDASLRLRRTGTAVADRPALAQALALLGQSQLASSLDQLARAAAIGALLVTPATEAALRAALADIRLLRSLLVKALGLKEEAAP